MLDTVDMPRNARGTVLVVDDDPRSAEYTAQLLRRRNNVEIARNVEDALALQAPPFGWRALVLNDALPDGTAFDVIDGLDARGQWAPPLILTDRLDRLGDTFGNGVLSRSAKLMQRRLRREDFDAFLDQTDPSDTLGMVVAGLGTRGGLSLSEVRILRDSVDVERVRLATYRGNSETELAREIESLVRKVRATDRRFERFEFGDVVRFILREALLGHSTMARG